MKTPNIVPELKKVIDSIGKRDMETFEASMEKLATKFQKVNEHSIAEKIRFEGKKTKQRSNYHNLHKMPTSKGTDVATVYTPVECEQKSKYFVLDETNQVKLEELLSFYEMREEFFEQEVSLPNKIVMFGPPGTGKTMSAFYLAFKLNLPLLVVRLDAIIDSHMGETSSNIRKIFDYAKKSPCILFLDEFDAIARSRGEMHDVKEMSRVVNTLLQCMDEFDAESIIMAATNLDNQLDNAVWRRFDTKMTYNLPGKKEKVEYLGYLLKNVKVVDEIIDIFVECSFADIAQICMKAKRKAIINKAKLDKTHIKTAFDEYFPRGIEE